MSTTLQLATKKERKLEAAGIPLPSLITRAGHKAALRFAEFFTVNIRNRNTREAYGRAAAAFLNWCEERGLTELHQVQPIHVAAYIEQMQENFSKPTVKQHLATIRMMLDWLVTGQVIPTKAARRT